MRRNKYGAKRCEIDGHKFDSLLEGGRYRELALLQKAKRIERLGIHTRWPLLVGTVIIGHYESDFDYRDLDDLAPPLIVEDCKGWVTPLARWKLKHFEAQYGIQVKIVRRERARRAA